MQNVHINFENPYTTGLDKILGRMFEYKPRHKHRPTLTIVFTNSDKSIAEAEYHCGCNQIINLIAWKSHGATFIATQAEYDPQSPFKKGLKGSGRDMKEALQDLCEQIELEYCNQACK